MPTSSVTEIITNKELSAFNKLNHFAFEHYEDSGRPYILVDELVKLTASIFDSKIDDTECVELAPNEKEIQALVLGSSTPTVYPCKLPPRSVHTMHI